MIKKIVIKRKVIKKKEEIPEKKDPSQSINIEKKIEKKTFGFFGSKAQKKIKKIKTIKDEKFLTVGSTYSKVAMLFILIIGFVIGNFFVIKPTINSAKIIEPDLIQKKSFLETSETSKIGLIKKTEEAKIELERVKNSFFNLSKVDEFYTLFSEAALDNQLSILSLNKSSEEFFKKEKKDEPGKFDTFDKYKIVEYDLLINGNFIDYLNFIKTLQKYDKSFVVVDSTIEENEDGKVNIRNKVRLSLLNIWEN